MQVNTRYIHSTRGTFSKKDAYQCRHKTEPDTPGMCILPQVTLCVLFKGQHMPFLHEMSENKHLTTIAKKRVSTLIFAISSKYQYRRFTCPGGYVLKKVVQKTSWAVIFHCGLKELSFGG